MPNENKLSEAQARVLQMMRDGWRLERVSNCARNRTHLRLVREGKRPVRVTQWDVYALCGEFIKIASMGRKVVYELTTPARDVAAQLETPKE